MTRIQHIAMTKAALDELTKIEIEGFSDCLAVYLDHYAFPVFKLCVADNSGINPNGHGARLEMDGSSELTVLYDANWDSPKLRSYVDAVTSILLSEEA